MRFGLAIAVAVVAPAVAVAAAPTAPTATPGQPAKPPAEPVVRIDWRTDLDAALREAVSRDHPVLIYFHADWCEPCRLMDGYTFANRALAYLVGKDFVPVKVDDSKEAGPVSKKYGVRIYPSILVLSKTGEPLHMVLFPRTAAELHPILQKVAALPRLIEQQAQAPDDLEANFRLGEAWANLDHLHRAEPYLARVVQMDPRNERGHLADARLMLAIVPLEDGNAAQALKNLRQFMEDFKDAPQAPTALYAMGAILMQDGKFQEARKVFDDVRTRFPRHEKAYQADKAIDAIDARLKAGPAGDKKAAS